MNPKNRRLQRSVAAAGISLLGIGVAASYLILGASAPAQAAGSHILKVNLASDSGSVLIQEGETIPDSPGTNFGGGYCLSGQLPKGWLDTSYPVVDGSKVQVLVFGFSGCTDQPLQELVGTVPGDDGLANYWLQ